MWRADTRLEKQPTVNKTCHAKIRRIRYSSVSGGLEFDDSCQGTHGTSPSAHSNPWQILLFGLLKHFWPLCQNPSQLELPRKVIDSKSKYTPRITFWPGEVFVGLSGRSKWCQLWPAKQSTQNLTVHLIHHLSNTNSDCPVVSTHAGNRFALVCLQHKTTSKCCCFVRRFFKPFPTCVLLE